MLQILASTALRNSGDTALVNKVKCVILLGELITDNV